MEVRDILMNMGLEPSLEVLFQDEDALYQSVWKGEEISFSAPDLAYEKFNELCRKPFGERLEIFLAATNEPQPLPVDNDPLPFPSMSIAGKTFVITGKLGRVWRKREQLEARIHSGGGVVRNKVDYRTDYLITNTPNSGSQKNQEADRLGIRKITERDFARDFLGMAY